MAFKNCRDIAISDCFDKQYMFVLFKIFVLISFFVIFLNKHYYDLQASEIKNMPDVSNVLFEYVDLKKNDKNEPTGEQENKIQKFVNCSLDIEQYFGKNISRTISEENYISVNDFIKNYYNVLLLPDFSNIKNSSFNIKENFLFQPFTIADLAELNKHLNEPLLECNLAISNLGEEEKNQDDDIIVCQADRMDETKCEPNINIVNCEELKKPFEGIDPNTKESIIKTKCYPKNHICYIDNKSGNILYKNLSYNNSSFYSNKLFAVNQYYFDNKDAKAVSEEQKGKIENFYLYKKQTKLFDPKYNIDKGNANCVGTKVSCNIEIYYNMDYLKTQLKDENSEFLFKMKDYKEFKNFISIKDKSLNEKFFANSNSDDGNSLFTRTASCVLKETDSSLKNLEICKIEILKSMASIKVLKEDNNTVDIYYRNINNNCVGYLPACDQVPDPNPIYFYNLNNQIVNNVNGNAYSAKIMEQITNYGIINNNTNAMQNELIKKIYVIDEANLFLSKLSDTTNINCLFQKDNKKEVLNSEEPIDLKVEGADKSYCSDLILNANGTHELKYKNGLGVSNVNVIGNTIANGEIQDSTITSNTNSTGSSTRLQIEVINPTCYLKSCIDLSEAEVNKISEAGADKIYCSGFKWLLNKKGSKYFSLIKVKTEIEKEIKTESEPEYNVSYGLLNSNFCTDINIEKAKINEVLINNSRFLSKKNVNFYNYFYSTKEDSNTKLPIHNTIDDNICENWEQYNLYQYSTIGNIDQSNQQLQKIDVDLKKSLKAKFCKELLDPTNFYSNNCYLKRCVALSNYEFGVVSTYNYENKKNIILTLLDNNFKITKDKNGLANIFTNEALELSKNSLPKICENKVFFNKFDTDINYVNDFLIKNPVDLALNLLDCKDFSINNNGIQFNDTLLANINNNGYDSIIKNNPICINFNSTKYVKSDKGDLIISTLSSSNDKFAEQPVLLDSQKLVNEKFLKIETTSKDSITQKNICTNTDNLLLLLNGELGAHEMFIKDPIDKITTEISAYAKDLCMKQQFAIDQECTDNNFDLCKSEKLALYEAYKADNCFSDLKPDGECYKNCTQKEHFDDVEQNKNIFNFFVNCNNYVEKSTSTITNPKNIIDCNLYRIIGEENLLNFKKYTDIIEVRSAPDPSNQVKILGKQFLKSFDEFSEIKKFCYNKYDSRYALNVPDSLQEPNRDPKLFFPMTIDKPANNNNSVEANIFKTDSVFCGLDGGLSIQGCFRPNPNTYYINTIIDPSTYKNIDNKNLQINNLESARDIGLKYVEVYTRLTDSKNPQLCGIREGSGVNDFPSIVLVDNKKKTSNATYVDLVTNIDGEALRKLQDNELSANTSIHTKMKNRDDFVLRNYKYSSKKIGRNICVFLNQDGINCNLDTQYIRDDQEIVEQYCKRRFVGLNDTYIKICNQSYELNFESRRNSQLILKIQKLLLDKGADKITNNKTQVVEFLKFIVNVDVNEGNVYKVIQDLHVRLDENNFQKLFDLVNNSQKVNCSNNAKEGNSLTASKLLFKFIQGREYKESSPEDTSIMDEYKLIFNNFWTVCNTNNNSSTIKREYALLYSMGTLMTIGGAALIVLGNALLYIPGLGWTIIGLGIAALASGLATILAHTIAGHPEGLYFSPSVGKRREGCIYSGNGIEHISFSSFTNVSILNNDGAVKDLERNNLKENTGIVSDISLFKPEGYPTMYYNKSDFYQNIKEKMATDNISNKLTSPLEEISWNVAEKCGLQAQFNTYHQLNKDTQIEKKFSIATKELAENPEIEKCLIENGFSFLNKQFVSDNKAIEEIPYLNSLPFGRRYNSNDIYRLININGAVSYSDNEDKNGGCGIVLAKKLASNFDTSGDSNLKVDFIQYIGNDSRHNEKNINCYLDSYGNPIGDIRYCRGIFALVNQFTTTETNEMYDGSGIKTRSQMNFDVYDQNNHTFDYFYPESQCLKLPLASSPQPFFTLANMLNTPDLFDPILFPYMFMKNYHIEPNIGVKTLVNKFNKLEPDYFRPEIGFKYDFTTRDPSYKNLYEKEDSPEVCKARVDEDCSKQFTKEKIIKEQIEKLKYEFSTLAKFRKNCKKMFEDKLCLDMTQQLCYLTYKDKNCFNEWLDGVFDGLIHKDITIANINSMLTDGESRSHYINNQIKNLLDGTSNDTRIDSLFTTTLQSCKNDSYKTSSCDKINVNVLVPIKIDVANIQSPLSVFKYRSEALPEDKELNIYLTKEYTRSDLTFVYEPKICTNYLTKISLSSVNTIAGGDSLCVLKDSNYCYLMYLKKYDCYDRKTPQLKHIYMKPSINYNFNNPAINVTIFDESTVHSAVNKTDNKKITFAPKEHFTNSALALVRENSGSFDIKSFGKNEIQQYGINFTKSECSGLDTDYFNSLDIYYKEKNLEFKSILLKDLISKEQEMRINCNIRNGNSVEVFSIKDNGIKIEKLNVKRHPEFYDGFNQMCISDYDYEFIKEKNIEQNKETEKEDKETNSTKPVMVYFTKSVIAYKRDNAIIKQEQLLSNKYLTDIKTKCWLDFSSLTNNKCLVANEVYRFCEKDDFDCNVSESLLRKYEYDTSSKQYVLIFEGKENIEGIMKSNCTELFAVEKTDSREIVCMNYVKKAIIDPYVLENMEGEQKYSNELLTSLKKIDCKTLLNKIAKDSSITNIYSDKFDSTLVKDIAACYNGGYNAFGNVYRQDDEKDYSCECETYNGDTLKEASIVVRKNFNDFFYDRKLEPRELGACVDLSKALPLCEEVKYSSIYNEYVSDTEFLNVTNKLDFLKLFFLSNKEYHKYIIQHIWRSIQKSFGYVGSSTSESYALGHAEFRAMPYCDDSDIKNCLGGSNIVVGECKGFFTNRADTPPKAKCVKSFQSISGVMVPQYKFELLPNTGCVRYSCPIIGTSLNDERLYNTYEAQEEVLMASNSSSINENNNIFKQSELDSYRVLEEKIPNFAITNHEIDSNVKAIDTRGRQNGYAVWGQTTSDDFLIGVQAKRCLVGYGPAGSNYAREKYFQMVTDEKYNFNYNNVFSFYQSYNTRTKITENKTEEEKLVFYTNYSQLLAKQVNYFYNDIIKKQGLEKNLPIRYCDQRGQWLPVRDIYNNLSSKKETDSLKFEFYGDNPNINKIFNDADKGILKETEEFYKENLIDKVDAEFTTEDADNYCEKLFCPNITIDKYNINDNVDGNNQLFANNSNDYDIFKIEFKLDGTSNNNMSMDENVSTTDLKTVNKNTPWRHTGGASWNFTSAPRNSSALIKKQPNGVLNLDTNIYIDNIFGINDRNKRSKYMYLKKVQGTCEYKHGYYARNSQLITTRLNDNKTFTGSFDTQLAMLPVNKENAVNPKVESLAQYSGDKDGSAVHPTRTCNSVGLWSGVSDPCFRACEMMDMYHTEYINEPKYLSVNTNIDKDDIRFEHNENFVNESFNASYEVKTSDIAKILLKPDYGKFRTATDLRTYIHTDKEGKKSEYYLKYGDYLTGGAKWPRSIVKVSSPMDPDKKMRYIEVEGECDSKNAYFKQIRQYGMNDDNKKPKRRCYEDGTWGPVENDTRCVAFRMCKQTKLNLGHVARLLTTYNDYKDKTKDELLIKLNETLSTNVEDYLSVEFAKDGYKSFIKKDSFLGLLANFNSYTLDIASTISPNNIKDNSKVFAKITENADFIADEEESKNNKGATIERYRCDMGDESPSDPNRNNTWALSSINLNQYIVPNFCNKTTIEELGNSPVKRLNLDNIKENKIKFYTKDSKLHLIYDYLYGTNDDFNTINNQVQNVAGLDFSSKLKTYIKYKFNTTDKIFGDLINSCNKNIKDNYKDSNLEIVASSLGKVPEFTDSAIKNYLCKDINIGTEKYHSYQYMAACNKYFFSDNNAKVDGKYIQGYSLLECVRKTNTSINTTFVESIENNEKINKALISAKNCLPKVCGSINGLSNPKQLEPIIFGNNEVQKGWNPSLVKEVLNNKESYGFSSLATEEVSSLECPTFIARPLVKNIGLESQVLSNINTGFIIMPNNSDLKEPTNNDTYDEIRNLKTKALMSLSKAGLDEKSRLAFAFKTIKSDCMVNEDTTMINGVSIDKDSYLFNRQGALYLGTEEEGINKKKTVKVKFCKDINRKNCNSITEDILQNGEEFVKVFSTKSLEFKDENKIKELPISTNGYCIPLACEGGDITIDDIEGDFDKTLFKKDSFKLDFQYYNFGATVILENFMGDFTNAGNMSQNNIFTNLNTVKNSETKTKEFNLCKPGYNQYSYGVKTKPLFNDYIKNLTKVGLFKCPQYFENIVCKNKDNKCDSNEIKYSNLYYKIIAFKEVVNSYPKTIQDDKFWKYLKEKYLFQAIESEKLTITLKINDIIKNNNYISYSFKTFPNEQEKSATEVKLVTEEKLKLEMNKFTKFIIEDSIIFYKYNNNYYINLESANKEKFIELKDFENIYNNSISLLEKEIMTNKGLEKLYDNNKFKLIYKEYSFNDFKDLINNLMRMKAFLEDKQYANNDNYKNLILDELSNLNQDKSLFNNLNLKTILDKDNALNIYYGTNSKVSKNNAINEDSLDSLIEGEEGYTLNNDKEKFFEVCVNGPLQEETKDNSLLLIETNACITISTRAEILPQFKIVKKINKCPANLDEIISQDEMTTDPCNIEFEDIELKINDSNNEIVSSLFNKVFEKHYLENTFESLYARFLNKEITDLLVNQENINKCTNISEEFIQGYKSLYNSVEVSAGNDTSSSYKAGQYMVIQCQNNGKWKIANPVFCKKRCNHTFSSLTLDPNSARHQGRYEFNVNFTNLRHDESLGFLNVFVTSGYCSSPLEDEQMFGESINSINPKCENGNILYDVNSKQNEWYDNSFKGKYFTHGLAWKIRCGSRSGNPMKCFGTNHTYEYYGLWYSKKAWVCKGDGSLEQIDGHSERTIIDKTFPTQKALEVITNIRPDWK